VAEKVIRCKVLTPEACVLDGEVLRATIPAWDGELGVLHRRAALLTRLGAGELRVDFPVSGEAEGGARSYYVEGGFARVVRNRLTLLTNKAIPAEQLSESEAQAELAEAEARVVPEDAEDRRAELREVNRQRINARAKLRVARAVKGRGGI